MMMAVVVKNEQMEWRGKEWPQIGMEMPSVDWSGVESVVVADTLTP